MMDDWEFSVLGMYNFNNHYKNKLNKREYFEFIKNNYDKLSGDILEVGVFNGGSLLSTALLLKELNSDKKVYGFDSFSGFGNSYHNNDELEQFGILFKENKITESHYSDIKKNLELRNLVLSSQINKENISNSKDFSSVNLELLESKIDYLGLDNIVLVKGFYEETMNITKFDDLKFMCCLMDCDLYQSHKLALKFLWPKLIKSGYIYFDDYYSLKFPGSRIAVNEFFENKKQKPKSHIKEDNDFERWFVIK
jgi:hypothetical protein